MSRRLEASGKSSMCEATTDFCDWSDCPPPSPTHTCVHTAATSPAGSPGSAGTTVESTTSEPSTEVAGTPPEEQTTRYAELRVEKHRKLCCFIESLWISVLDVIHQGKIYSVLALWLVQSVHASTAACLCRRVGSCVHIYLWKQNLLSPWCSHFLGENIFTLPWRPQPSSKNFSAISICTSTLTGEVVMSFWWLSKAKLSVRWAVLSLTLEEN